MRKVRLLFFFGTEPDLHVQFFKEGCDKFESIRVALSVIIESGSVHKNNGMPIQVKNTRGVHRRRTRFQPIANGETGFGDEIYELTELWSELA